MAPFDLGHGAVPYLYLTELKLKAVFPILAKSFFISDSCYIQSFSADFGQRESRLNSMPGKCCFSVFFSFCLEWIVEYFFSKSLPHFRTLGFVKHFVYLCYVAVHGTNVITCLLMLDAKVHMY